MSNERSPYDYEMLRTYSNMRNHNSPPWPGTRSHQDMKLQQRFCPDCNNVEGYAPLYGFRTDFDKQLQQRWCGPQKQCEHGPPNPHHHPHPPHPHVKPQPSPYNPQPHPGSYMVPTNSRGGNQIQTPHGPVPNPYGACGGSHSSGPSSMPSSMMAMQMPMGANCNCQIGPFGDECGKSCTTGTDCGYDGSGEPINCVSKDTSGKCTGPVCGN